MPGGCLAGRTVSAMHFGKQLLIGSVAATVLLAGCSAADDGDAAGPAASPSESSTPLQVIPTVAPEEAEKIVRGQVTEAVRDFYQAVNRSFNERSTEPLDAVVAADCACRERYDQVLAQMIADDVTFRGHFVSGQILQRIGLEGLTRAVVTVGERTEEYEVVGPDGEVKGKIPADSAQRGLVLERRDGRWLIVDEIDPFAID